MGAQRAPVLTPLRVTPAGRVAQAPATQLPGHRWITLEEAGAGVTGPQAEQAAGVAQGQVVLEAQPQAITRPQPIEDQAAGALATKAAAQMEVVAPQA